MSDPLTLLDEVSTLFESPHSSVSNEVRSGGETVLASHFAGRVRHGWLHGWLHSGTKHETLFPNVVEALLYTHP